MNDNQGSNPSETVPGANQLAAAGGNENGTVAAFDLKELNQMLGREYKDVPTALAAIKETYNFVGAKAPAPAAPVAPVAPADTHASKDEVKLLREDLFYSQNPQYQEHRQLISKLGDNPAEVVGAEGFKSLFEKAKAADDATKSRSVVSTNARLGQTSTKVDDAVKAANTVGIGAESLATILAEGIKEEYGME